MPSVYSVPPALWRVFSEMTFVGARGGKQVTVDLSDLKELVTYLYNEKDLQDRVHELERENEELEDEVGSLKDDVWDANEKIEELEKRWLAAGEAFSRIRELVQDIEL